MSLPLHKCYETALLHDYPNGPRLEIKPIAKFVGCNKSTVSRWPENKEFAEEPKNADQASQQQIKTRKLWSLRQKMKMRPPPKFNKRWRRKT
jgi:hypothetical protein